MPDDARVLDVAVVGGGITGAAAARDAVLRGFSVALFEKGDFASGTTSKTSRLIHGGLRYLEGFHVGLVAESLGERDWLFSRLPHLMKPLPILVPVYRGDRRGMAAVGIGIGIYDLLARRKTTPHYGTRGPAEVARLVPGILTAGLRGGALFYDYQMAVPERLVVENLLSAASGAGGGSGADLRNYAPVEAISFEEGLYRLRVRDLLSGTARTVSARTVVNATGPWADRTRRLAGLPGDILYPTKGAHIVLPGTSPHALFAASPRDDRMFYILPFEGRLLVGTTDTPYSGDPDAAAADPGDVAYLVESSRRFLPSSPLFRDPPLYAYAGVRPLLAGRSPTASRLPRRHGIFREGPGGRFVTVAGGKLTTFRKMAEDAVDAAALALGRKVSCTTRTAPFPGEIGGGPEGAGAFALELAARFLVPEGLCRRLVSLYGRRAERVLEIAGGDPDLAKPLAPGSFDIAAQAILAAREEWARTPEDAILRRLHSGIEGDRGAQAMKTVAALGGPPGPR